MLLMLQEQLTALGVRVEVVVTVVDPALPQLERRLLCSWEEHKDRIQAALRLRSCTTE